MKTYLVAPPKIVSREEWLTARMQHLQHEKALTQQRDQLNAERRGLPWVKVEKTYRFKGPQGTQTLCDLFGSNSQLLIYHFMFGAGWKEGCKGCSFVADHFDGANLHLPHHDVSLVVVSHAPLAEFLPFKQRMGWDFDWVSSAGSDFNEDYQVSATPEHIEAGDVIYNYELSQDPAEEMPGLSVFYKNPAGEVFHTYSTYARGMDILLGTHNLLDLTPKGRDEQSTMGWVRHHDRYDGAPVKEASSSCAETSNR
ncbi:MULTISPECIES: thioredoxin family protein [unclassified Pseudomonas]|uniref:DUF899 domain-containing protein n=1 Tax=unclassified Pseudomonas TaxID=196821 RepID=UPI002AC9E386|nr:MULTISPECIES: thioredoxin family protein [unclassified Pseudomonas]MEB0042226.1 thioredoxin family protein [Pseudomonas sp. MH10]MEB0076472.1 thioredoxin family protein [Pseudomonas sp. MH10out]MEB0091179.1 thioredoxin family protein [Pseudomonas sp. CCI4.2]MEB0100867.1 thioredoxin family protein [Pseudomonas sp. CCI3.2]MEB0119599.1 thioredoxin family protein [Pseudomonas sp. CCI1.2]